MSDLAVYRSVHPDTLTHVDKANAARDQWRAEMKSAVERWSVPEAKKVHLTHYGMPFAVDYPSGSDIPDGWRRDRRMSWLVPAKSTIRGKGIAAEMGKLVCPDPARGLPGGMPCESLAPPYLLKVNIHRYGRAVFAVWSSEPAEGDLRNVDPAVWERIRLSEYYAAREAEHDAEVSR